MNRAVKSLLIASALLTLAGCPGPFAPTTTTIELVNAGSFAVSVTIYIGGSQETTEVLLTTLGTKIEQTVAAGQTATITRDCDDLQAIIVDDADLQLLGGIGPDANTGVYRDGTDFGCGDTIRFTFSHPAIPTSLEIDTTFVNR